MSTWLIFAFLKVLSAIVDNYIDIDECSSTNNCTELQNCINTPGSFVCTCLPGYTDSLTSPLRCEGIVNCCEVAIATIYSLKFEGKNFHRFQGFLNYCITNFLMGQNIDRCTSLRNLKGNIDRHHLRPPVLAILLYILVTIEMEKFDRLL